MRCLVNALSEWLPYFNQNMTPDRLDLEDLQLLADFYYLPYEYGKEALNCINQLNFILTNIKNRNTESWRENFNSLTHKFCRIDRLTGNLLVQFLIINSFKSVKTSVAKFSTQISLKTGISAQ
jgi:hypothetical protein